MEQSTPAQNTIPDLCAMALDGNFSDVDMFAIRPLSGDGADTRLIKIGCAKRYFAPAAVPGFSQ
jgi:hypothetical protein